MSDSQRARVRTARGFYIAQTDKRADLLTSTIRPTCAILAEFAFHESDEGCLFSAFEARGASKSAPLS
jgi:hypothetical protein